MKEYAELVRIIECYYFESNYYAIRCMRSSRIATFTLAVVMLFLPIEPKSIYVSALLLVGIMIDTTFLYGGGIIKSPHIGMFVYRVSFLTRRNILENPFSSEFVRGALSVMEATLWDKYQEIRDILSSYVDRTCADLDQCTEEFRRNNHILKRDDLGHFERLFFEGMSDAIVEKGSSYRDKLVPAKNMYARLGDLEELRELLKNVSKSYIEPAEQDEMERSCVEASLVDLEIRVHDSLRSLGDMERESRKLLSTIST